ncbi:conserved oligomeric Golgi complex subunit 5-like [Penaeus japonicus]|uniref:conserved oligomeric Golgi complex subunit 5-like n=1 Tax=Penaeus japonicus TaxID=27405 RepID=UPI001C713E04|nr:conserved oligomeric Golgi complex subunit 5-like [Penaeus japonicus]
MAATVFKEFQEDATYAPFLEEDFDVQSHTSQMVQGVIIAEQLNKLTLGINRLEREIESQVGSHYEDLLSQATGVETLEDVLNTMHTRIQTLLAGVERLRVRVVDPYQRVEKHTLILGRLQATCELLRRVIRCLMLSQRLQQQLANGPRDITKAASSLSELDHLGRDVDLTGLEVLERDQRLVRQARSDVEKQAVAMMDRGMEAQNQTQVATALQVFHNLGILVPSVEKVLESLITRLNNSVSLSLDVNALTQVNQDTKKAGPGKAIMPAPGQSAQFRASLWSNLEKLMDDIYHVCVQTSHLHKVLAKKRDPVTHVCFLDEVQRHSNSDLFTRVWRNITRILTEEFAKAAQDSPFIRQALEVDYPKLVRLYGDLWRRLEGLSLEMRHASTDMATSGIDSAINDEDEVDKGDKKIEEFEQLLDLCYANEKRFFYAKLASEADSCPWQDNGLVLSDFNVASGSDRAGKEISVCPHGSEVDTGSENRVLEDFVRSHDQPEGFHLDILRKEKCAWRHLRPQRHVWLGWLVLMNQSLRFIHVCASRDIDLPLKPLCAYFDTFCMYTHSELNISAVDKSLSETVARNVVKTLQLFCTKCEQLLVTDGEASQVIGSPTAGQALNGAVVNQLLYVRSQIERTASATLAHLPQPVTNTLLQALPAIDSLMASAVQPLFLSITQAVEAIILTMHNEDFSGGDTGGSDSQCSLYMKELQGFINRVATDYVAIYQPSSIIKENVHMLACRCLELFVRHASLLRPIGEGGKLRLAADFAQMELAISPLCNRPSELGKPYRIVRTFRPLLFQTTDHISTSPSIGDVIPYSVILHFLFAKAPSELRSPHQTAGWSVSRYSNWLDEHRDERERLQLVRGALEAYVANVRSRNLTQFAPVYPVMLKLLERGMNAHGMSSS